MLDYIALYEPFMCEEINKNEKKTDRYNTVYIKFM